MADPQVRVFMGNDAQPATTVTIPGRVLKIATDLVPQRALAALRDPRRTASSSRLTTTLRTSGLSSPGSSREGSSP
jgi:hypothetical protein